MTTAEQYARDLWEAAGQDDELGIPGAIFHRVNQEHGIHLTDPCGYCHGIDGHETWCSEGLCACGNDPANCTCDAATDDREPFPQPVADWDAWRDERLDAATVLWEGEGEDS